MDIIADCGTLADDLDRSCLDRLHMLDETHPGLRERLGPNPDVDDIETALDGDDDELADALGDLGYSACVNYQCDCTQVDADCQFDWLESWVETAELDHLPASGQRGLALFVDHAPHGVICVGGYDLTAWNEVIGILPGRNGWDGFSVRTTEDPTTLAVSVGSSPSVWHGRVIITTDAVADLAAGERDSSDYAGSADGLELLARRPDLLEVAERLASVVSNQYGTVSPFARAAEATSADDVDLELVVERLEALDELLGRDYDVWPQNRWEIDEAGAARLVTAAGTLDDTTWEAFVALYVAERDVAALDAAVAIAA